MQDRRKTFKKNKNFKSFLWNISMFNYILSTVNYRKAAFT